MKIGMDTKYLKNVLVYFLTAIAALILIFYLCYHLFNGFSGEVQTYTAEAAVEHDTLTLEGYLFRGETVIRASQSGVVDYAVPDGSRVGRDALLARVYAASDDGSVRRRVIAIDEELALLEASAIGEGVVISDTSSTDAAIEELLYTIRGNLASGIYDYARRATDSLLIQLNRRRIVTGEVQNYAERMAALSAERAALTARLAGAVQEVSTASSGYFFYGLDGYESTFGRADLQKLTLAEFDAMRAAEPEPVPTNAIGKLVDSYIWYLVVPVEKSALDNFEEGGACSLTFPYHFGMTLTMKLERTVTELDREDALLIFSSSVMPEDFSYLRVQNVEVSTRAREGLRVPAEAIRVIGDQTCVYILRGGKIELRRVEILLEREGNCIVAAGLQTEEGEIPYLALYDEVITAGKDLYDGKVLK